MLARESSPAAARGERRHGASLPSKGSLYPWSVSQERPMRRGVPARSTPGAGREGSGVMRLGQLHARERPVRGRLPELHPAALGAGQKAAPSSGARAIRDTAGLVTDFVAHAALAVSYRTPTARSCSATSIGFASADIARLAALGGCQPSCPPRANHADSRRARRHAAAPARGEHVRCKARALRPRLPARAGSSARPRCRARRALAGAERLRRVQLVPYHVSLRPALSARSVNTSSRLWRAAFSLVDRVRSASSARKKSRAAQMRRGSSVATRPQR